MVSEGSWKDYGLSISSKQVGFSVFRNATENALYKICKNFKPKNKNLKYLITDTSGKIFKNSYDLRILLFYWPLVAVYNTIGPSRVLLP